MNLLIKFSDESKSFTYGVEFGRILERMAQGITPVSNNAFPIRVENKSVIIQSCTVYNYIGTFGAETDGWLEFMAIKKETSDN